MRQITLQNTFKLFLFIWIVFIPMKTSFYAISYVGIVLVSLIYFFREKPLDKLQNFLIEYKTLMIYFLFVVASMTISNILSPISTFLSWRVEFNYVFRYFLLFLIFMFFYKEKFFTKRFLLVVILLSLPIQAMDGVYQTIFNVDIIKGNFGSLAQGLSGATFNRNTFGMFMAIGVSICSGLLFLYKHYNLKKTEIAIVTSLLLLFLFCLLFSYSRASWVSSSVFLLVMFITNYKKLDKLYILYFLIFALLAVLAFYFNHNLSDRFSSLVRGDSSDRFTIWKQTISFIKSNFFFGYGLMTYKTLGAGIESGVHNSVLKILFFLGLVGFLVYTNLIFYILKHILSNKNYFYLALFVAFLTITQFDDSIIKGITSLSTLTLFGFFIFAQGRKQ